jgi:hypothetical protein
MDYFILLHVYNFYNRKPLYIHNHFLFVCLIGIHTHANTEMDFKYQYKS